SFKSLAFYNRSLLFIKVVLKNTKKVFTFFFVSKSFKVISLFSYQSSLLRSFVKQLLYYIKAFITCQELF
ncbi:MAG: hypothetical protein SPG09_10210, partial [Lachnospiraceae bacterium]|nr:hypothetical protein [bacterium]MDY5517966.1 hypothetical protein [Lachnospiraceae bacterium]